VPGSETNATSVPRKSDSTCDSPSVTTPQTDAFDVADWFRGRNEIRLLHRGQEYRLRVTRQGKLILTK
jgi:hemin uptake protein HemP